MSNLPVLANRAKETSTTTGTGPFSLDGAVTGYFSFESALSTNVGQDTFYVIENVSAGEFEIGIGKVIPGTPDVLYRTGPIERSSNSDQLVNFSAGTKNVFSNAPASYLTKEELLPLQSQLTALLNELNIPFAEQLIYEGLPFWKLLLGVLNPQDTVNQQEDRYQKAMAGVPIVWGDNGGVGVTNNLTLSGLADAAGRMGVSRDLGVSYDQEYEVHLWVETGTAPTAGNQVELYLACSYDGINWPGKVTGGDAAYPTTVSDNKKQLWPPVLSLYATNDTNTLLLQNPIIWRSTGRFVVPVVVNALGQSFRSATNSRVILIPRMSKQTDVK